MRCRIPRGYFYLGKVRLLIDFTAQQVERVFITVVILASVKIGLLILQDNDVVVNVLVLENLFVLGRIIIVLLI